MRRAIPMTERSSPTNSDRGWAERIVERLCLEEWCTGSREADIEALVPLVRAILLQGRSEADPAYYAQMNVSTNEDTCE
jgi:hypothetical protein